MQLIVNCILEGLFIPVEHDVGWKSASEGRLLALQARPAAASGLRSSAIERRRICTEDVTKMPGHDRRDDQVGPPARRAPKAKRRDHHGDIADGVVPRADPNRADIGVALLVSAARSGLAKSATSARKPTTPMTSARGTATIKT